MWIILFFAENSFTNLHLIIKASPFHTPLFNLLQPLKGRCLLEDGDSTTVLRIFLGHWSPHFLLAASHDCQKMITPTNMEKKIVVSKPFFNPFGAKWFYYYYYPHSTKPLGSGQNFLSYRAFFFFFFFGGGGCQKIDFFPKTMEISQKVSKMWNIVRNV